MAIYNLSESKVDGYDYNIQSDFIKPSEFPWGYKMVNIIKLFTWWGYQLLGLYDNGLVISCGDQFCGEVNGLFKNDVIDVDVEELYAIFLKSNHSMEGCGGWVSPYKDLVIEFSDQWTQTTNVFPSKGHVFEGEYSVEGTGEAGIDAVLEPSQLSGGVQASTIEFYWWEESGNSGFTTQFVDSSNQIVLEAGSSQPAWELNDGDGMFTVWSDNSWRWIHFKFNFNWNTGEYTYFMRDMETGHEETGTRSLMIDTDIESIKINANQWGDPNNEMKMHLDKFVIDNQPVVMFNKPSKGYIKQISAGEDHVAALKSDGTILTCGAYEDFYVTRPRTWTNVKQVICMGYEKTAALLNDGRVRMAAPQWYYDNWYNFDNISTWENIVKLVGIEDALFGFVLDGSIVGAGNNINNRISDSTYWTDVQEISIGDGHTLGLKSDGTVIACGGDDEGQITGVSNWTDIVKIYAGSRMSAAIKSDGTVVACGQNDYGQLEEIVQWKNMESLLLEHRMSGFIFGIDKNKNVFATSNLNCHDEVKDW